MLIPVRGALRASALLVAVFLEYSFGLIWPRTDARAAALRDNAESSAVSAITPQQVEFFEKKIRPVLSQNCYSCHSTGKGNSGHLHLDDRNAILTGGKSGPAMVPGNPEASLLIQRITSNDPEHRMPKDDDPLPASRNELAGYPGVDTFTDYYNRKDRWGNSGNDVRNRLIGNVLYDLPIGRGQLVNLTNPILNRALGNWAVGALGEFHSGTSLSVIDLTNNSGTFSDGVRPSLTGNPNDLHSGRSRAAKVAEWFDTSAFTANPKYTFGNAPRTFGRGPRLVTADASLSKKVPVLEGQNLELRLEALNVFNQGSLGNPNSQFGSPNFGVISSLQSGGTPSRTLQLAAHFTF